MRYCLALDLQKDATLIAEYEEWHRAIWPEIRTSITGSGITEMEIWRLENRLFMIMETGMIPETGEKGLALKEKGRWTRLIPLFSVGKN